MNFNFPELRSTKNVVPGIGNPPLPPTLTNRNNIYKREIIPMSSFCDTNVHLVARHFPCLSIVALPVT